MNISFRCRTVVGLFVPVLLIGLMPAKATAQAELTVAKAIEVLNEISIDPKSGPPRQILLKAEGIAVIPNQVAAGFVFGGKFGRGIVMVRRPDGSWSNPVFITAVGGSFGLQAGAQATDLVLVFKGRRSVESFLKGKGKLTMGLDASAAAGPIGRNFEAGTDLAFKAEILSYSRSRGIFAGVSAAGGTLSLDRKSNSQYYGMPVGSEEILADNSSLKAPPSAAILKRVIAGQTGTPVSRKGKSSRKPIEGDEDEPTIVIEGEDELPEDETPRQSSRSSSSQTKRTSSTKSASRASKQRPASDDEVILAAGEETVIDADSDQPPPKKAKSTSWKKSKPKSSQPQKKAPVDLDEAADDTSSKFKDE